ncbi:MAG: amino acid ABC transporter permease [Erysipelotrichaceae bacterium]|nr:amino acid ABC transporter permease [Erysipelotrichaceae bacterium]
MVLFISNILKIFRTYGTSLLLGVRTTLLVAITGTLAGLVIGLIVGGIRAIRLDFTASNASRITKKIIDGILNVYIGIFRGTPMMVQALFIYYLLLDLIHWTYLQAAIVVISINTGAYMAEIIRSGIQSVDEGQREAARALGMSNSQTMMEVILPQAIKNAFPAVGNEFIVNIKDSSVLMIISITELMFQAKSIAGSTFLFTETYFIEAVIYFILTTIASIVLNAIERHMDNGNVSLPMSDTNPASMNLAYRQAGKAGK